MEILDIVMIHMQIEVGGQLQNTRYRQVRLFSAKVNFVLPLFKSKSEETRIFEQFNKVHSTLITLGFDHYFYDVKKKT